MAILAIDTAANQCAIAILLNSTQIFTKVIQRLHGQSERLLPMIDALLNEAGLDYISLAAIAVTTGPGSFTGLRVGLAAAQGLALALDIPVVGIDSFAAYIAKNELACPVLVVIESRRSELYWQLFDSSNAPLTPPACDTPQFIAAQLPANGVVIGDGAAHIPGIVLPTMTERAAGPDPVIVARLAEKLLRDGVSFAPAQPLYIRPPDAQPKSAGRV